mgnify:FL=1
MKLTLFIFLLAFLSCKNQQSREKKTIMDSITTQDTIVDKKTQRDDEFKRDSLTPVELISIYKKSQSADTVVPLEIYIKSDIEVNIDTVYLYPYYEAFMTYDMNREYYQKRIKRLFYFDDSLDKKLDNAEKRIRETRKLAHRILLSDLKKYNSIEGRTYSYLVEVKDSSALKLADKMFKIDSTADHEIKGIAYDMLYYFNDSTYVKKLKNNE